MVTSCVVHSFLYVDFSLLLLFLCKTFLVILNYVLCDSIFIKLTHNVFNFYSVYVIKWLGFSKNYCFYCFHEPLFSMSLSNVYVFTDIIHVYNQSKLWHTSVITITITVATLLRSFLMVSKFFFIEVLFKKNVFSRF